MKSSPQGVAGLNNHQGSTSASSGAANHNNNNNASSLSQGVKINGRQGQKAVKPLSPALAIRDQAEM